MILHILNKGPSSIAITEKLISCLQNGDQVILIEDGVYHCTATPSVFDGKGCSIYTLEQDAVARGVEIVEPHASISYREFVQLTIDCDKSISWY